MVSRFPKNVLVLAPLLVLGCSDNGFTQLTNIDVFQQEHRQTFDLLVVVDNSCSMVEEQAKLATNFDAFIQYFEGADVDWQLGVVTTDMAQDKFKGHLIGGDDEIVLTNAEGVKQDEVTYDHSWAVEPGVAYALDPTWDSVSGNDSLDHWCKASTATPGQANAECAAESGSGANPALGAVIITEFLADPSEVDDTLGEWVEITNISDAEVDLSGWTLSDEGRNAYAIPSGTSLAAGGTLVFARSDDSSVNGGVTGALAVGDAFTLNNDVLVLSPSTDDAPEIFSEMVAQGTTGSGTEMGLAAAAAALTEPLISTDNAGFLRDEANLNVFIVSDEEDSSPDPVADYLSTYADVKGDMAYRDHSLMNVSTVVGMDPPAFPGEPSCSTEDGNAAYGSRYVAASDWTDGLEDSICDADFSPIVSDLGLLLSGLQLDFALSAVPDLETLEVSLYDTDGETKLKDLTIDVDFTYVEDTNSIHFEYSQVPDSDQYIQAEYKVRS